MMQRAIIGLCLVLLLVSMNVSLAEEKPVSKVGKQAVHSAKSAPEAAQTKPEFPVVFADTEIFIVSTSPVGSLSPENRAKLILQNIQNFANSEADLTGLKVV